MDLAPPGYRKLFKAPCPGARRLDRRIVEPERVGLVDAEMRARIPIIDALYRDVLEVIVDHDGLRHARDGSDRELLVGLDLQHFLPDSRARSAVVAYPPLLVEVEQRLRRGKARRLARLAAGIVIVAPFRPLHLIGRGGR